MNELYLVLTTTPTKKEAKSLAKALLQEHLVACAQIHKIQSLYHWDKRIAIGKEYRLILKTTRCNLQYIRDFIAQHHSYEIPQYIEINIHYASQSYEEWVIGTLK